MQKRFLFLFPLLALLACNGLRDLPDPVGQTDWKTQELPASPQNRSGDAQAGLNYLIYGDYIGTGVPFSILEKKLTRKDTVLNRSGKNSILTYNYNAFAASNGVDVVAGNCFTCHASVLNNEVVLGLGNAESDFQKSIKFQAGMTNLVVKTKFGKKSKEYEAFEEFGHLYKAIAPWIKTPNPGVNPAFRLEEACANYRDPVDLSYRKDPNFETIRYTLAADVPPLWNIDKKNALYYNGMGRGDFAKLLMQASVLGIPDSTQARKVHRHFVDVVAWASQLQPPPYPGAVDEALAAEGRKVFDDRCSRCHGTYGEQESYPNKLVALDLVKTDPYYARYFTTTAGLAGWYNQSWFANSAPASRLEPQDGYVAPPLDGIWATAPYLHNGSVPTLEALLNSPQRPALWKRTNEYDYENVGWKYETPGKAKDGYDTRLPGYGNMGHYFGDKLSPEERKAVIEYLKTL
ncbi:MAG: c-type cytochrome [Lewinellaceae bacterium]|nr:c-type cytochrome [Lewinellaceae bacterium]